MTNLVIGCLTVGSKKPKLITTLNVMGAFYRMFFFTYLWIYNRHGKFTSGAKVRSHTLTENPPVKVSVTTVKGVPCNRTYYIFRRGFRINTDRFPILGRSGWCFGF